MSAAGLMRTTARQTRENRTITVDFQNEATYQTMAEDHARKSVGECHPYREFEGMQSSIKMKTSLASATGVSPWVSTRPEALLPCTGKATAARSTTQGAITP